MGGGIVARGGLSSVKAGDIVDIDDAQFPKNSSILKFFPSV